MDWSSPTTDPHLDTFLSDADLALALYEDEIAQLCLADSRPATPAPTPISAPSTPHNQDQQANMQADLVVEEEGSTKECQICFDTKHTDLYPLTTEASNCTCLSDACLACLQEHIRTQMKSKEWKDGSITCPMCNRSLVFQEIEEYADGETLATHTSRQINHTLEDLPNFTRCPNPTCASGQIHDKGAGDTAQPIVTCAACHTQFCFRHRISLSSNPQDPSPHENMSCPEYDEYLSDPLHFRSDHQIQQERARHETREHEAMQRARGRVEEMMRLRRERAAAVAAGEDQEVQEEERRRQAAAAASEEEARRLERARQEHALYEEERERRRKAEEVVRRRVEELQSERRIEVSTKGCPRCAARIEKNEGW